MTWLWRICFSAWCLTGLAAAPVTGRVEIVAASSKKKPSQEGVVVWLEPKDDAPAPMPVNVVMKQLNKQFQPHVLAVPVGSSVEFPNLDPIFHNAFSNVDGQPFDVGLYPPGTTRRVVFRRAGVVRVFCNIHQAMSAVIVVVKSPYVTVSSASGAFSFGEVPAGDYTLHVFYERSTAETLKEWTREINVGSTPVKLPVIGLSESGYLQLPHKNKYGKDYPPASADGYGVKP